MGKKLQDERWRMMGADAASRRGHNRTLRQPGFALELGGQQFESLGSCCFKLRDVKCSVSVKTAGRLRDGDCLRFLQWLDENLYKSALAMRAKAKKEGRAMARNKVAQLQMPTSVGDMRVTGASSEGKLRYAWGSTVVDVTPRRLRAAEVEGTTAWKLSTHRETTPDRALRKMKEKLQKSSKKEEAPRIIARTRQAACSLKGPSTESNAPIGPGASESLPEQAPALKMLNDPDALAYVRAAFEFLGSSRLHYCENCDEEWLVFDQEWPQAGVSFAGPKAGKCETIARAGWEASWKKSNLCGRCATTSAYKKMYCEANKQHLGPRYSPLSNLTWYETMLIARVHPVVSVITLLSTGLLCYAGHVCNYYLKVFEWFRGLPAVLRDKKWFLVKRRRSIQSTQAEMRQKKPTTANRQRLMAGIQEALVRMPNVYSESLICPEELEKFPLDGEQEMLAQAEHVDLRGGTKVSHEMFAVWLDSCQNLPLEHHCASSLMQYAKDEQGIELRGGVSSDTARELCCRELSLPSEATSFNSSDLSQFIMYLLEEGRVPFQFRDNIYKGMLEDLQDRGRNIQTEKDEIEMKARWVKQILHKELDTARELAGLDGTDMPVDLDIDCTMVEGEAPSISVETEEEARRLQDTLKRERAEEKELTSQDTQGDWAARATSELQWGEECAEWDGWYGDEAASDHLWEDTWGYPDGATENDEHAWEIPSQQVDAEAAQGASTEAQVMGEEQLRTALRDDQRNMQLRNEAYNTQLRFLLAQEEFAKAASLKAAHELETRTVLQRKHGYEEKLSTLEQGASHSDEGMLNGNAASEPAAVDTNVVGKPLVDAPEFGDRVRDTDRQPYWIPGAFPGIFQNETGDPYTCPEKEVDLITWGPHVLRSRGWHAQAHMTFMYWWMNMVQRIQALSAKKWYVRDNPQALGYTAEDLSNMNVRNLAKQMVGYTGSIPGTKASKARLRKLMLAMVRQIEIETRVPGHGTTRGSLGDVPCFFGTLTTQRYHWDEVIRTIAKVEGITEYKELSKSKRRELVNKYPLFVAWYLSVRLELTLKTIVVPIFGAHSYVAVYEWSPTGGMVHMHYILWKSGAPRFDVRAEKLVADAEALRKAGLSAAANVECEVDDVIDFFADFVTDWNANKTSTGTDEKDHAAEKVNEALPHCLAQH